MAMSYDSLQQLRTKAEVSCFKLKGEDFHCKLTEVIVSAIVGGEKVQTTCALLGVFDGHGGKRAADFACKQVCSLHSSCTMQLLRKASILLAVRHSSDPDC